MGLLILIAGLILFLGVHVFVTLRDARATAIARFGDGPYKGLFSLVAIIGVVAIVWGFGLYRQTGWVDVWYPPTVMRHVTALLVWPAIILVLAAYLPGRIRQVTKHPMLAGVTLWAFAHLLSNGDLGSIVLFGSFLAWGVYARIAAKRRGEEVGGNPTVSGGSGRSNDAIAIITGTVLYFALGYWFHPAVIGVPAFGR
ncbi:MAG: NnrU family protein [Rhizobiales bacterium]|nr:NnrU family protein [Hyphomicrobiales bacterium]